MRFILSIILLAATVVQARPGQWPGRPDDSFRQSCRVVYENYFEIRAYCRSMNGQWIYNDFDRRGCVSGVANMNGYLTCQRGGPGPGLPPGSYLQSCDGCYVDGGYLTCSCLDMSGYSRMTSIYYPACQSPIANMNGQLVCN